MLRSIESIQPSVAQLQSLTAWLLRHGRHVRSLRLHDLYVEGPDDLSSASALLNSARTACAAAGALQELQISGSQPI